MAGNEDLFGTWKLLSFSQRFVASGERIDAVGKHPQGILSYSRDGRMSAILANDGRPKAAAAAELNYQERAKLFDTFYAYAGTFSFDGETVTHHVDISWNESWTGTHQVRRARVEGNRLYITTDPEVDEVGGRSFIWELVWEKVPGAN